MKSLSLPQIPIASSAVEKYIFRRSDRYRTGRRVSGPPENPGAHASRLGPRAPVLV